MQALTRNSCIGDENFAFLMIKILLTKKRSRCILTTWLHIAVIVVVVVVVAPPLPWNGGTA